LALTTKGLAKDENVELGNKIGRTVESERFPITMDEFWFSILPSVIVGPFDFVSVDNIYNTRTIGIIKELRTVSSIHSIRQNSNGDLTSLSGQHDSETGAMGSGRDYQVHGTRIARVAVMAHVHDKYKGQGDKGNENNSIIARMPVGINASVAFANSDEILLALGIPKMEDPVMAGLIEMTNGNKIAIPMAMSYLAGPDAAHINASGISGNLKTSYLLFLLHSLYQKLIKRDEVAIIIFNTREDDLLHLDEAQGTITDRDKELYDLLEIPPEPFTKVIYYLPRGIDGKPISTHIPSNYQIYSYELNDIYDRLDLLFSSETYDPRYNLSAIINYIYESWPLKDKDGAPITTWSDLVKFKDYPPEILTHKSTYLHFSGLLQKYTRSSMFTDKRVTSTYLGNEIEKIRAGDVFVIDIAMVPTVEEQSLVIGDVMKNIDELYSSRSNFEDIRHVYDANGQIAMSVEHSRRPKYLLIFIDEINRFLPQAYPMGRRTAVAEQIAKTLIAGRSRDTILLSAQQFKSSTDPILHENTGIHMIAKLGMSELSKSPYAMLDDITKNNIVHMNKGEIVMVQPAIRHPVKVVFPRPPFKRPSR
jgi:DNA helicase HerA-like ATPase